jgi:carbohydrate-selective porin OprB
MERRPPVKLSKTLPGGISVGGEIGSWEGTSLDQTPWALLPPLGIPLETVQGAWTFNVSVDQFVWMHPNDPTKGMGLFGMFGVSDGDPSLLRTQMFVGFGGAAPFEGRSADSFGAAFFYNDVSNAEDTLRHRALRIRNEQVSSFTTPGARGLEPRHCRPADHRPVPPALRIGLFFTVRWKVSF